MTIAEGEPFFFVVHERPRLLMHDMLMLCDPSRLDRFYGGIVRGWDICDLVQSDLEAICTEGIAVLFVDAWTEGSIIIRHHESQGRLAQPAHSHSRGWILETETGKLVLCSMDSLLFWNPEEEEDDEEAPRFVHLSIPPGCYMVELREVPHSIIEEADLQRPLMEFVLTPVLERPPLAVEFAPPDVPTPDELQSKPLVITAVVEDAIPRVESQPGRDVDERLLRSVLSRFSRSAFQAFIKEFFGRKPNGGIHELGNDLFYQTLLDSYGGSLHSAFLTQSLPLNLFAHPQLQALPDDPSLLARLLQLKATYEGQAGHFGMVSEYLVKAAQLRSLAFLVNISNLERSVYEDTLIPGYSARLKKVGLHVPTVMVGSYDSFIDRDLEGVDKALKNLLTRSGEGLTIQVKEDEVRVHNFTTEQSLDAVLGSPRQPLQPLFTSPLSRDQEALREFEELIRANAQESELENFLAAHYGSIFGEKYDRIETQIWLRFPELDIAGQKRRFDMFLRNAIDENWELFEIKRVAVPMHTRRRGVLAFSSEVVNAMQQLRNYARTLSQERVKEHFRRQGIEYAEPSLGLVIGRRPEISLEDWHWLLKTQAQDVNFFTYDSLLKAMRRRLDERTRLLDSLVVHEARPE